MIFGQNDTALSDSFFSEANQNYLQNAIKDGVYSTSGYKIGDQNSGDLWSLMGVVYTNLRGSNEKFVPEQVAYMNQTVVSNATNTIISGIKQDLSYLHDISILPTPPPAPKTTSTYGTKLTRTYNPFA
jgi:hypothetical protein